MLKLTKSQFKQKFELSIAILEADYGTVYYRYFITRQYGLGIAVTYRFSPTDVEHHYYEFEISSEIKLNLNSAYLYITDKAERNKSINSEMISIFNKEIMGEFTLTDRNHEIIKQQKEDDNVSNTQCYVSQM